MQVFILFGIVVIRTIADICFKLAVNNVPFDSVKGSLSSVIFVLKKPLVWIAVTFAGLNLVGWWLSLSRFDLSYAYPFTALIYITIIIAGKLMFNEQIDRYKAIGMGFILAGVACMIAS